ncbi:coth protein-domain-containing protein [Dichotomocladium elegans]|nr:coth protein-domain-containing protein [Dichotomocladium elegans]
MKLVTFLSLGAFVAVTVSAIDVQYAVVAFPREGQSVSVITAGSGQSYTLQQNADHPNLFSGTAPYSSSYQYALTDGTTGSIIQLEAEKRTLNPGTATTGNEFFDRAPTIFHVPELPQAFYPIYPPLFTTMNKSNEIATILLEVDKHALHTILSNPNDKHVDGHVSKMTYISNTEVFSFTDVGLDNIPQANIQFSRQSFELDLNKYVIGKSGPKQLLFGRAVLRLQAEQNDPSFMRTKLAMDFLAATGAATFSSSWVRVIANGDPLGLFLLTDDVSTHTMNNLLHAGDWDYASTGPTYRGSAVDATHSATLQYLGSDPSLYPEEIYKLMDKGHASGLSKQNAAQPLIELMRQLATVDPKAIVSESTQGILPTLIGPDNLMHHMAINFLLGSWDGFWFQANNYYLHQDLSSGLWYLVSSGFDETLGNGIHNPAFSTVPYQQYKPSAAIRVPVDVILGSPYYKAQFEHILTVIIKRFFKPSVVRPRIEAWRAMLRKDLAWDRGLGNMSPGQPLPWTMDDFEASIGGSQYKGKKGTSETSLSIGEWVERRSASLCKQLGISSLDDIPPLGLYDGEGRMMDSTGQILDHIPIQLPTIPLDPTVELPLPPVADAQENSSSSSAAPAADDENSSILGLNAGPQFSMASISARPLSTGLVLFAGVVWLAFFFN